MDSVISTCFDSSAAVVAAGVTQERAGKKRLLCAAVMALRPSAENAKFSEFRNNLMN